MNIKPEGKWSLPLRLPASLPNQRRAICISHSASASLSSRICKPAWVGSRRLAARWQHHCSASLTGEAVRRRCSSPWSSEGWPSRLPPFLIRCGCWGAPRLLSVAAGISGGNPPRLGVGGPRPACCPVTLQQVTGENPGPVAAHCRSTCCTGHLGLPQGAQGMPSSRTRTVI